MITKSVLFFSSIFVSISFIACTSVDDEPTVPPTYFPISDVNVKASGYLLTEINIKEYIDGTTNELKPEHINIRHITEEEANDSWSRAVVNRYTINPSRCK